MKSDRGVIRSFTMIGQFGINMLVPVLLCSFLGAFLDKRLGTSFLVIVLFFLGAAAGFWNIYRMSRAIFGKQSMEEAYLHRGRAEQKKHRKQEREQREENHNKNQSDIV